jgi:hypothetical protein
MKSRVHIWLLVHVTLAVAQFGFEVFPIQLTAWTSHHQVLIFLGQLKLHLKGHNFPVIMKSNGSAFKASHTAENILLSVDM